MDLKGSELGMLARHLGHDPKTHKEYYRLTSSTVELSKVMNIHMSCAGAVEHFFYHLGFKTPPCTRKRRGKSVAWASLGRHHFGWYVLKKKDLLALSCVHFQNCPMCMMMMKSKMDWSLMRTLLLHAANLMSSQCVSRLENISLKHQAQDPQVLCHIENI